MITIEKKSKAIKSAQTHAKDTGGPSAQVAILTERIKELTEHLKVHKHDFADVVDSCKWLEKGEDYLDILHLKIAKLI